MSPHLAYSRDAHALRQAEARYCREEGIARHNRAEEQSARARRFARRVIAAGFFVAAFLTGGVLWL